MKKYNIVRVSPSGERSHFSGPHKWTVVWRKAAKLNTAPYTVGDPLEYQIEEACF